MRQKIMTMVALVLVNFAMLLCAGCHGSEAGVPTETVFGGTTGFTETTSPTRQETTLPSVGIAPIQPETIAPTIAPTPTEQEETQPTVTPTLPRETAPNEHIPDADEGEEHPLTQPETTEPTQGNEQEETQSQVTVPKTDTEDNVSIDPDQIEEI